MNGNPLAEQIKALRQAAGMTQEEFAKKINVAKSTVCAYENGSRLPSYDVLIKIAGLFHVSTDNLLGHSGQYKVDVTGLTPEQRGVIHKMVETFQDYNRLAAILGPTPGDAPPEPGK